MSIHQTLNTIARGLVGGGESISFRRRYAFQLMTATGSPLKIILFLALDIPFFHIDDACVPPNEDYPIVTKVNMLDWKIK